MSITAKATLFFVSPDSEGWSESFYLSSATINNARTAMDTIIGARLALLADVHKLIYARVSDVAVKGDSLLTQNALPQFGTYPTTGVTVLEANTCVLAELFATSLIKNRIFIRGITGDVVGGREYLAPSAWDTAFTTWGSVLLSNTAQARHRVSVGPPPTYSYTNITSVFVDKATARKPGRPFDLPRGRR